MPRIKEEMPTVFEKLNLLEIDTIDKITTNIKKFLSFDRSHQKMQLYRGIKLPGTDEKVDGMVFLENPYCPMGHFNTDWTTGGQVYYYMNLPPLP